MPEFAYRAIQRAPSKQVRGTLTAYSPQEAEARLTQMGFYPLAVQAAKPRRRLLRKRLTRNNLLSFTIQLRSLLASGVPVVKALEEIAANEPHAEFRVKVEEIRMQVEQEGQLTEALAAHPKIFPQFYIGAFRAGEAGGTLPEVLSELTKTLERQMEFDGQLKQAMTYPIVVSSLLIGVGVLYMGFVLPKILGMVQELGAKIPPPTKLLILMTRLFTDYWFVPLSGLLVLTCAIRFVFRDPRGRLQVDRWVLRIPLLGSLVQRVVLARFSHFLALLLHAGYELLPSLEIVKGTVGNRYSAQAIEVTRNRIQSGESLSESMRGLSFIPFVISMIAVGEKSGRVADQLDKVAEYYEREVERSLKKLLSLLEPVILIVFGAFAAVVILGTFLPMYQSMSLAK